MQTRASKAVASAAAATRARAAASTPAAAAASAVTPSPPAKRHKPRGQTLARPVSFSPSPESAMREEMRSLVLAHVHAPDDRGDGARGNVNTNTMGGWCLVDGLTHCAMASNGVLLPMIREHGPPIFYIDYIRNTDGLPCIDDGYKSFRSLCRIVAGQQLAGAAAKTIWGRLLGVVGATEDDPSNLTPERILSIVENGDVEVDLRAPAGLSNAKCRCIVAIATSYREGALSEALLGREAADDDVRSRLLSIKGLGPWSVDMFLLFQCHRSNILPIGDLAIRNGTSNLWAVKGKAKGGGLCPKKDEEVIRNLHEGFAPYRSISSFYMYKCSGIKQ